MNTMGRIENAEIWHLNRKRNKFIQARKDFLNIEKAREKNIPLNGYRMGECDHFHETLLYLKKDYPSGYVSIINVIQQIYYYPDYCFSGDAWVKRSERAKNNEPFFNKSEIRRLIEQGAVKLDIDNEINGNNIVTIKDPKFMFKIGQCHTIIKCGKEVGRTVFMLDYYEDFIDFKKREAEEIELMKKDYKEWERIYG